MKDEKNPKSRYGAYDVADWQRRYRAQVDSIIEYQEELGVKWIDFLYEFYELFSWLNQNSRATLFETPLPHWEHLKRCVVFNVFLGESDNFYYGYGINRDILKKDFIGKRGAAEKINQIRGNLFGWGSLLHGLGWGKDKLKGPFDDEDMWMDIVTLKARAAIVGDQTGSRLAQIDLERLDYDRFVEYHEALVREGFENTAFQSEENGMRARYVKGLVLA